MIIRKLFNNEIADAVDLRIRCWNHDYMDVVPANVLNRKQEINYMIKWINEKCDDIRMIYGAFIDDIQVGFVGASIAEKEDTLNGLELNYLFVAKEYRGQKIGLKLFQTVATKFNALKYSSCIVYNWHDSASNSLYYYLGGQVLRQSKQVLLGKDYLVDIFIFDLPKLCQRLAELIEN